jgi:ribosomal protein S18 acetylase RimI-like enzyme
MWTGRARAPRRHVAPDVRPLGRSDRAAVLAFVEADPVRDTFIASRVLHDAVLGVAGWGPLWGAFDAGGRLTGVLHLGPNLVPAVARDDALTALATVATGPAPTRMLVGERGAVERLWDLVAATYPPPREIRERQFVYRVTADELRVPAAGAAASVATRADEEEVLAASAAMHLEEMGEDPMTTDPAGYRRRVRALIDRGWTFVHREGGRLAFKMDIGCAATSTAQIQGVYTPTAFRRRGVGTAGMAACCLLALRQYPVLSLYVNDFNVPAVSLYERLGFRRMPYDFATVLLS